MLATINTQITWFLEHMCKSFSKVSRSVTAGSVYACSLLHDINTLFFKVVLPIYTATNGIYEIPVLYILWTREIVKFSKFAYLATYTKSLGRPFLAFINWACCQPAALPETRGLCDAAMLVAPGKPLSSREMKERTSGDSKHTSSFIGSTSAH